MRMREIRFLKFGLAFGFGVAIAFFGGIHSLKAITLPEGFIEAPWGGAFSGTTSAMRFTPDGRLFVCEKAGALRVIDAAGNLLATPFLTVTVATGGECGLASVEFDPDFANNHFVYIYYTATTPAIHNRISRFTANMSSPANGNIAVAGSEVILMELEDLTDIFHNGGALHFGPDGKLYLGVGDYRTAANSQLLSNRKGKILRINADPNNPIITGPGANPTAFPGISGSTTGANRAIWAVGLRNPFSLAFEQGTGRMLINDVGEGSFEEINDGIAGLNYGWPDEEGPTSPPNANYTDPIYSYAHSGGNPSAITGGEFYHPAILQFPNSYVGKYFFGDYARNFIRYLDPSNNTATDFSTSADNPVDLHSGPDGALYVLSVTGQVRRIQAIPSQATNISTRARIETGDNVLIGGFIVTGTGSKDVLIRGLGPSLPAAVPNRLADPFLDLRAGDGTPILTNNNWQDTQQAQISATGLAPSNSLESAIVASLQPGTYTAIMSGNGNTSGIGLIEIYDLNTGASSRLGNISSRGFVQTGDNVMIGGFIVGNNIGAAKVVVRALGPSLASAGITNPLANPTLELHDSNGALIRFNNNWQEDATQAAQITSTGLQPSNSLESAIFAGLAPGLYTAIVAGFNGGTGIALVEVYEIP
jgi:glucose/arabinose dehydrogenase